jgi:lipid II:glycine glycyltransferase (peptidoglycan interpeptide bridge formation enzyme)
VVFTTSPSTGELKNGLVFCRIRSWLTGRRLVSLPFSDHCEPLFESEEELVPVVNYLTGARHARDWKYLEVRPITGGFNSENLEGRFQPVTSYCLHGLDIRPTLDTIFRGLHKSCVQRRIRHAERAALTYERGNSEALLKDFYALFVLTRSRYNLPPQPYAWFSNLTSCFGKEVQIRLAYKNRLPIAAVLTLRFRNTVYYKYGCSDVRFNSLGATPFLLWMTIQESKAVGAEDFNLGRSESDNEGLIVFKNHWAKGPTPLTYWRFPASDIFASRAAWKLRMAKRVFARMPDNVLVATGRLIYRHIG